MRAALNSTVNVSLSLWAASDYTKPAKTPKRNFLYLDFIIKECNLFQSNVHPSIHFL